MSASLIVLVLLPFFFRYYVSTTSGVVKSSLRFILFWGLIGSLGHIDRSDYVFNNLGPAVYILAAVFLVTRLLMLGVAIIGSPALDQPDWPENMVELYVTEEKSGVLPYHYEFTAAMEHDEELTAAGIAGVQGLFKELTRSSSGLHNVSTRSTISSSRRRAPLRWC